MRSSSNRCFTESRAYSFLKYWIASAWKQSCHLSTIVSVDVTSNHERTKHHFWTVHCKCTVHSYVFSEFIWIQDFWKNTRSLFREKDLTSTFCTKNETFMIMNMYVLYAWNIICYHSLWIRTFSRSAVEIQQSVTSISLQDIFYIHTTAAFGQ